MRRPIVRLIAIAGAVAGTLLAFALIAPVRRGLRTANRALGKRLRYERGRAQGVQYHLAGNAPNPDVADDVLADRVRSSIGSIEKRLDIPRVHIAVTDHIAHIHGVVGTTTERFEIERAVEEVSGVRGIESYLHVGLGAGDTRPSEAHWHPSPSRQLRELLDAARSAGAPATGTWLAVRAVLSTFADRIPEDERHHVFSHLPADVVGLAAAPHRRGAAQPRTVPQLVNTVQLLSGLPLGDAGRVTEAVVGTLRTLVPDEVRDVAATLPSELRTLWTTAVPA